MQSSRGAPHVFFKISAYIILSLANLHWLQCSWNMGKSHEQWPIDLVISCKLGILLPVCKGVKSHQKDPYEPISILECHKLLNVAHITPYMAYTCILCILQLPCERVACQKQILLRSCVGFAINGEYFSYAPYNPRSQRPLKEKSPELFSINHWKIMDFSERPFI